MLFVLEVVWVAAWMVIILAVLWLGVWLRLKYGRIPRPEKLDGRNTSDFFESIRRLFR